MYKKITNRYPLHYTTCTCMWVSLLYAIRFTCWLEWHATLKWRTSSSWWKITISLNPFSWRAVQGYTYKRLAKNRPFQKWFSNQDNQLRVAVMDYLNRFHKDDRDLQKVASLRFNRFREIAALLCEDARRVLSQLAAEKSLGTVNGCE